MSFNFHLPDIGEGVIEGEIVSWKVGVGDTVSLDQPMVEVQTDKATVEIPSPRAGTISEIRFQEGEICPVGDILVIIDTGEGAAESAPAAAAESSAGNGATQVTPPTAPAAPPVAARPEVIDASADRDRVLATPSTRRLARKLGVDLGMVPATGKNGRVTSDDVRSFADGGVPEMPATTTARPAAVPAVTSAPAATNTALARTEPAPIAVPSMGDEERIPFRGVRRKIADNMVRSAFTATHFTYVEEVDMTEMVEVRKRIKAKAAERGIKLTYLPFLVKAVVAGLKKWPALNASLDEATQEIVRKFYYHIGIAAQGPNGLVVTTVRDCDRLSIFGIAREIQRLADAVQDGSITRDDMTGSTFTISSLGVLGGVMATPIINFPEVGILGVHKMSQRPAVVDGEIVPRWLMNLSISLDHRLVDGWDGAMFIQEIKGLLEDPELLFMEQG